MSNIEASIEGRALLARLKSLIKDYSECMEAWDFIKELLQGQNLRHCHAWGTREKPVPVIRARICTRDIGESRLYCVSGAEATEEFRGFLRGLRQQILKL